MNSLLPVLLAHLLVDVAFKTERMRARKSTLLDWGAYIRHGLLVCMIMLIALVWSRGISWRAFVCAPAVAGAHLGIDLLKYQALHVRDHLRKGLTWLFFGGHEILVEILILLVIHTLQVVALCVLTGFFFPPRYELATLLWYVHEHLLGTATIPEGEQLPYLAILFLSGTFGGARVIQFAERAFYPGEIPDVTVRNEWVMTSDETLAVAGGSAHYRHTRTEEQCASPSGRPGVSYWVGILERTLIMLWPLMPALGLTAAALLGAKSVARYNQFKHRAFVEYFIVGTLASMIWGAVFAWLIGLALRK